MNQVQKIEERNVVSTDSTTMMEIIARAASDPATDVGKLERLMAMAERIEARNAKAAYYAGLSAMQDVLPVVQERGEIKINENKPGQKYALWEDINKAIKPILREHGFALSFKTGMADTKITVTGILSHRAGHSEETTIHLPADTSGSKNAVQAVGSSSSYGRRYTAILLLNLTSSGTDDDGRAAGGDELIGADQLQSLQDMIARGSADVEAFCKYMRVPALAAITVKNFPRAVEALNLKLAKGKK